MYLRVQVLFQLFVELLHVDGLDGNVARLFLLMPWLSVYIISKVITHNQALGGLRDLAMGSARCFTAGTK